MQHMCKVMADLPRITLNPAIPSTARSTGVPSLRIAQLAIGQLLEATVLSVRPATVAGASNTVHIGMGGQTLTANTSLSLNPGEQLTLRVERTDRQPTLSVVARKALPLTQPASVVSAALRANLPRQRSLAEALTPLVAARPKPESTSRSRMPTTAPAPRPTGPSPLSTTAQIPLQRALEGLRNAVPSRTELTDPATLAARIVRSGTFLEALLGRIRPAAAPAPPGRGQPTATNTAGLAVRPQLATDLKVHLNRVRAAAQANARTGDPAAIRALEQVDAALARVRILQIATLGGLEEGAHLKLTTELPVVGPGGTLESVEVRIEAEPGEDAAEAPGQAPSSWQVTLRLDLPTLGVFEAVIALNKSGVSTHFRAKSPESTKIFENALPALAARLQSVGLTVDGLSAETGIHQPQDVVRTTNHLVHVVI